MKRTLTLLVLASFVLPACAPIVRNSNLPRSTQPGTTGLPKSQPSDKSPFGVMLPSQLVRSPGGIQVAKTLGATYLRPSSIFLDEWNGICQECDIAIEAGLKLALTVRANGRRKPPRP